LNSFTIQAPPKAIPSLEAQLAANGFKATGTPDNMTIEGHGCHFAARYDSASQTLTIDVISKPFFIGMGMIQQKLKDAVSACSQ